MTENEALKLELKKETLSAWAKILLNQNDIDEDKYHKMLNRISKLKS